MNVKKISFGIKLTFIFLICFLFCTINLFAEKQSNKQIKNFFQETSLIISQKVKLVASDAQAEDNFGISVAVAGDLAIVGAYTENNSAGAAYLFGRNTGGSNAWGQIKKLIPSDTISFANFGFSVAIAGNVAVVGAREKAIGGTNSAGAAYIFERNYGGANSWGEVKKLIASDAQAYDYFGISVAVAENVAVVGAYGEAEGGWDAGAAYVFERNSGGPNAWGEIKKLIASDADEYDYFGWSVAMADEVAVIGAFTESSGGIAAGAAYVFEQNAGGANAWGEVKKLTASDAQANDYFGHSVAVEGNVAVIGAYKETEGGFDSGAAYVFEKITNGGSNNWAEIKKLTASDAQNNDCFGWSVSVTGDVAVIGAYGVGPNTGAAYVFQRNAGGSNFWGETKKVTASDAQAGDSFGGSVAIAGDVIIVGAAGEDAGGTNNTGAAYLFNYLINYPPEIAVNTLLFPAADDVLLAPFPTNIFWNPERITDDFDGTNLTITKISVHLAETTNEVAIVTNNINNLLGKIPWLVPADLIGGVTNYVLKFEVVDSSSLTNSRIFWYNKFTIVPEMGTVIGYLLFVLGIWRKLGN